MSSNNFELNKLLGICSGGLILTIFDSRYGDGFVVHLASDSENAEAIEDNFSGGDNDWGSVAFPLPDLKWFPIVYVQSVEQAIPALQAKLVEISDLGYDRLEWLLALENLGEIIRRDKHRSILHGFEAKPELQDLKTANEIFFKVRDSQ